MSKKFLLLLGVFASTIVAPTHANELSHNINISEFVITILNINEEFYITPQQENLHYANEAMNYASQIGLINLDDFPEQFWSEPILHEQSQLILENANQIFEPKKVEQALHNVLVSNVIVNCIQDGEAISMPVNLDKLSPTQFHGSIMLPVRPVMEALGYECSWDVENSRILLSNTVLFSALQEGTTEVIYKKVGTNEIISSDTCLNVSPQLINHTLYAPLEYFEEFVHTHVVDGTLFLGAKH
ncbi:MAG: hypothetical protein ATN36_01845 [Epulopiscium sp. Nele67-Bin005]|nr:MAG: hypothetical protein ATN36_01845 [Epulopiscium sp. Nele67-Bin005]